MYMEFKKGGVCYSVKLDHICAVAFYENLTTIYIASVPFMEITDPLERTLFLEWYNAQDKTTCHPVDDTKPLLVEKPKATTGRKKNA